MAVCYGFQQPGESPSLRLSDTPNIGMLNLNTLVIEVLIPNVFGFLAQTLGENIHMTILKLSVSYLDFYSVVCWTISFIP